MKDKIYVHVADDHKIVIDGIEAVLNTDEDIEVKGYSLTGKQVISWFDNPENKADVLVLDITMPIIDGIGVLQHFKDNKINQKVVIVSSYDDIKIVQEMLNLGCNAYITKNNAGEFIIDAIKAVMRGEQFFTPKIQTELIKALSGQKTEEGDLPDKYLIESLSDRELEVLRLITKQYNTPEIADLLNLGISTIDSHRKKLLKKLKVKNSVGLAMYAVKNKIV
ncbi:response regulator [Polaribacter sp. R77954]|uniref:response regulator n=1 Tax=Polaribacter sp. R77954 TaxID=3093870 RepID=UPI0037C8DD8B